MTRVAAVDCGTNSLRLLIADVDRSAGTLHEVDRRMEIVRLGQGVDATGLIDPAAMIRALAVTADYAARCRAGGVERIRFVATSATRDARNRDEFTAGVRGALGVDPEVVPGDEEARLSFTGATLGSAGRPEAPVLVVDIGGGSTEFVLGDPSDDRAGGIEAAISVDVGCVRMTERHLRSDPPTAQEIAAARADIDAAISLVRQSVPLDQARTLVGLAGTVTTVAAMALDLPRYLPDRIHHARIAADEVRQVARALLAMDHVARAALPFLHPGRVDVIGAGALVLEAILDAVPVTEVVVSEHDILDGIAWSLVAR